MTPDDKEESRGFKVQDRRRFSETGESRATQEEPGERPDESSSATSAPQSAAPTAGASAPRPAAPPEPEINFSTFVISLSTQALAHLGEIPNPIDSTVATDLAAARHMIDILGMLRDKTKGNLDAAEQALLDNILYDLRMRYVESPHHR